MKKSERKSGILYNLAPLLIIACFLVPAVQAVYIFDPNDPDSCPFEADVGEPIIGLPGGEPGSLNFLNGAQNSIAEQLIGKDITKGEYIQTVYPELWASLSEDEKNTYYSEKMKWSSSKQDTLSFAVIGAFSSPFGYAFAAPGSTVIRDSESSPMSVNSFFADFVTTPYTGYSRSYFSIQQMDEVSVKDSGGHVQAQFGVGPSSDLAYHESQSADGAINSFSYQAGFTTT